MRYPKPEDRYSCEVLCENFMEVDERLNELESGSPEVDVDSKADAIITSASSTTILTTDSAAVPPVNLTTVGKSTQRQYKGNQLFGGDHTSTHSSIIRDTEDWLTIEIDNTNGTDNKYIIYNFKPSSSIEKGKQYLCVVEVKESNATSGQEIVSVGADNKGQFSTMFYPTLVAGTTVTQVITARDDFSDCKTMTRTVFRATPGTKCKIVCRISIIADTTVTTDTFVYEPFVGNAPSPSIAYPQEVTPIGASGSVVEKVLSGNIYNSSFQKTVITIGGSTTENNGIYSTTASKTDVYVNNQADKGSAYQSNRFGWLMSIPDEVSEIGITITNEQFNKNFISFFDKDKISLGFQSFSGSVLSLGRTKMPKKTKYISLRFGKGDAVVGTTYETSVMVNYGEPLPYEPYSEQPLTLQTPNGLRGIPLGQTIPNAIKNSPIHMNGVYHDGEQYWIGDTKNENGKDVQRVLECDNSKFAATGFIGDGYRISYGKANPCPAYAGALCTHLLLDNTVSQYNVEGSYMYTVEGTLKVRFLQSFDSIDACKNYLNDNNIKFYMVLAEPIITETSEEEKAQYASIHMNYPNTTIVNDANAYMEVEYVADTKNYIDNLEKKHDEDIQTLKTAIIALGGAI